MGAKQSTLVDWDEPSQNLSSRSLQRLHKVYQPVLKFLRVFARNKKYISSEQKIASYQKWVLTNVFGARTPAEELAHRWV